MKRIAPGVALAIAVLVCPMVARAAERMVVVPQDDTPFAVGQDEFVRLSGQAISGGDIKAKIAGPAKLEAENVIRRRIKGEEPIGAFTKEFEIKPTGKGTVKVTLTVTSPIPNVKPKKSTYTFEVK